MLALAPELHRLLKEPVLWPAVQVGIDVWAEHWSLSVLPPAPARTPPPPRGLCLHLQSRRSGHRDVVPVFAAAAERCLPDDGHTGPLGSPSPLALVDGRAVVRDISAVARDISKKHLAPVYAFKTY